MGGGVGWGGEGRAERTGTGEKGRGEERMLEKNTDSDKEVLVGNGKERKRQWKNAGNGGF